MNIRIWHSDWSKSSSCDNTFIWLEVGYKECHLSSLPSWQVNMEDNCWMKFSLIRNTSLQVQDIWEDGEFSNWLLLFMDQNSFQELNLGLLKNHKHSGCIDHQQARWIDPIFFFKLQLLVFRQWWQLWMKTTTIKQRHQMNLFLVVFRSFVLLLKSMSKLIQNRCTCKLIIKTTAAYKHAHEQLRLWFLYFSPLFCSSWYSSLKLY